MRISLAVGLLMVVFSTGLVTQAQHNELVGLAPANAKISIDLQGVPLRDVINALAEHVKVTVQLADDLPAEQLDKPMDAVFMNATFHDVVELVLDKPGLSARVVDRWTILIEKKPPQN